MTASSTTPLCFPGQLIAAIHLGDKREIAAELVMSGIGAGVLIYHGIRTDGCCTCGDFNCPNAGKHPVTRLVPHGVRSASRDPRQAWQWFNLYPDSNLALALGPDLAAGDWDPQHGADLTDACGLPPRSMTARSGGGGMHRLVRVRPSWELKGGSLTRGVELRTRNQAIVIERSRHRSGGVYEWNDLRAPIAMLSKDLAARLLQGKQSQRMNGATIDPCMLDGDWIAQRWPEVRSVHHALLQGKYRDHARLLLAGEWEAAGYLSQSEAEYNLVLLVSDITNAQEVWFATLLSCGLGKRDREGTRRDDGHGGKLMRLTYFNALLTKVAVRRTELRQMVDPNLALARTLFHPLPEQPKQSSLTSQRTRAQEDVIDATLIRRGRPKGGVMSRTAQTALIHFLASQEVVWDRQGYIRVPMGEAAQAMNVSRETLRRAVNALLTAGIVEGPQPQAYKKHGRFAKDRYLRLFVSEADALARIDR